MCQSISLSFDFLEHPGPDCRIHIFEGEAGGQSMFESANESREAYYMEKMCGCINH